MDAILELLQIGNAASQSDAGSASIVPERVPTGEGPEQRAGRMIFRKWLALRHDGQHLGQPLTDPLPGPYGSWFRVYRHGRIYWHENARLDARLGSFVRHGSGTGPN